MKKKIMALLLAASIVTGVGTYGTYAYLQSDKDVNDNVSITMGTLDVAAFWSGSNDTYKDWTAANPATESTKSGNGLTFTNVKPGDSFLRDVYIVNNGSLDANVTAEVQNNLGDEFTVEIADVNYNTWGPKATVDGNKVSKLFTNKDGSGNHYMRVTIKVTINDTVSNEVLGKTFNADAFDFLKVHSEQTGEVAAN